MSSFAGIFRRHGVPVEAHEIARMLDALDYWDADRREAFANGPIGMGHLLLYTSATHAYEQLPLQDPERGLSLSGIFRLDEREALGHALGFGTADLVSVSDGHLILAAYRRWGEEAPLHLRGDFAFAIHDARRNLLLCCRDPFGVKPFYYADTPSGFAFASEMKGLLALPFVGREVNDPWIVDLICRLLLERDQTFWLRIRRLEPAHRMVVTQERAQIRRTWTPDVEREVSLGSEAAHVEAFRESLARAVRRRAASTSSIGAELSGGLDSSGIVALAAPMVRQQGGILRTYAQVRPARDPGEPLPQDGLAEILALVDFARLEPPHLLTGEGEGCLDTMAWAASTHDEPPRLSISLMNDRLYEAARRDGVRVLLSGFGGNQCVSASGWQVGGELLRRARFLELWRISRSRRPDRSTARVLAALLAPRPVAQFVSGLRRKCFVNPKEQKLPFRGLRPEIAQRHDLAGRYEKFRACYAPHGSTVRATAAARLQAPDVALRLEYSHVATLARRLEYRFPLLDRDLVEHFMTIPASEKWRGGVERWLFRRGLDGLVPTNVAWNNERASANPGGVLRLRRDAHVLVERLRSLPRASRVFDFVDPDVLMTQPRIRRGPRGDHPWERTSDLTRTLLLHEKLRLAEGAG